MSTELNLIDYHADEGPPLGDGFIEPSVPRDQVRQTAYPLPKDFEWCIMDLNEAKQVNPARFHSLSLF